MPAITEADASHRVTISLDAGCLHAEANTHPGIRVLLLEIVGDLGGHRAGHHPAAEREHVDLEGLDAGRYGKLQPAEAGAEHHLPLRLGQPRTQILAVVEDAQVTHI